MEDVLRKLAAKGSPSAQPDFGQDRVNPNSER